MTVWPQVTVEQFLRIAPYLARLCRISEIWLHMDGRTYRVFPVA